MDQKFIDYLRSNYSETITKEQFHRICHVSKKTAHYLLNSGLIPCINSGKKTRKYKIYLDDVITFLELREENPIIFKAPKNFYKDGVYSPCVINLDKLINNKNVLRFILEKYIANYDDVISTSKVVEITGYSLKTVLNWCEKGKLKYFNIFNRIMIPKEYLIDFLISDQGLRILNKSTKHTDILLEASRRINISLLYKK